ncbi:hypothetical protein VTK73DRAFT_2416 [Phialemonium thermophilum]|uniref:Uncharacterized protein n=1 Tax=Phialemonium thermophilum TaxID=223376 RepID=A0ABR3VS73_9PEZI
MGAEVLLAGARHVDQVHDRLRRVGAERDLHLLGDVEGDGLRGLALLAQHLGEEVAEAAEAQVAVPAPDGEGDDDALAAAEGAHPPAALLYLHVAVGLLGRREGRARERLVPARGAAVLPLEQVDE